MRHNMGKNERIFRVMLGIAVTLVGWFMIAGSGMAVLPAIILIVGIVLILTGLFAYCPLNALLHFNTCSECHHGEPHHHAPA